MAEEHNKILKEYCIWLEQELHCEKKRTAKLRVKVSSMRKNWKEVNEQRKHQLMNWTLSKSQQITAYWSAHAAVIQAGWQMRQASRRAYAAVIQARWRTRQAWRRAYAV